MSPALQLGSLRQSGLRAEQVTGKTYTRRGMARVAAGAIIGVGAALALRAGMRRTRETQARALYTAPLDPPSGALNVFHLGHSLVGRDMPAMLAQLAPAGHSYASQLGWGASLRAHWHPDVPVGGFDIENDHPRFVPAREALTSGTFGAVVLTEMVELRDALTYHDSAQYLANWARLVRAGRPDAKLYLYETWHHTDDPAGWLDRIDADYEALWLRQLALPAVAELGTPIHLIPAGQVLAAFVRALDEADGIGNVDTGSDLFARTPEGAVDTIHLGDLGAYLVALTHYAALYHRDPAGLPLRLLRADGTPAQAPDAQAGAAMQRIAWDVVRRPPFSGVAA